MKLLLDCQRLAKLLSQSQDTPPTLALQARMSVHLMTCRACRNVDGQFRFLRVAMQKVKSSEPLALPDAARHP